MTHQRKRPRCPEPKSSDVQQYPHGPKYRPSEPTLPPDPMELLSDAHAKKLATLVRKYGPEAIAKAAKAVVTRKPGRPSRGDFPYYERMHLADWLEERAEEHRAAGSRKPYTDAEIELYELLYGGEEEKRDLQKFRKTIKKARHRGRLELQEVREALKARSQAPKSGRI